LTEGRPTLTDVQPAGFDEAELLRLIASGEHGAEHPLARAIVEGAEARGLQLSEASEFDAVPGHGLAATVDGRQLLIGNTRLFESRAVSPDGLVEQAAELATEGKTAMLVANRRPAGRGGRRGRPDQAERRRRDQRPQAARS
jgi:Cu+-exporting ATPase